MDKVVCEDCGKSCIPRLWNYSPFLGGIYFIPVRHLKTQHLCAFCGICMYETGGEITFIAKLILLYVLIPLPLMYLIDDHNFPTWAYILYVLIVTVIAFAAKIKEMIKRFT
ncbi:hypothetical protein OLMES_0251 [Oleiphilus messinensis]|uniref:Uncharacterized protein n=1 Tax=Oleiphilus messinensis TaxID=141451 RepID=A0A1Y0I1M0_9GAMM|nr:hypothetical protein OLMES_0251 [Oleiphilus messinensis]